MSKILIATSNQDKLRIVTSLFHELGISDQIIGLADLDMSLRKEEEGSIQERAREKAKEAWELLGNKEGINAVIGVDDGFQLPGNKEVLASSKEITDQILAGQALQVDEKVIIVRAYCAILADSREISVTTRLPLVFLGNPRQVTRNDGEYPLGKVLAYLNTKVPVNQFQHEHEMNMHYFRDDLMPLIVELQAIK